MSEALRVAESLEPSTRRDADEWLRVRAQKTIQAHLRTREDVDFAQSVKSMIDQTVHEYGGRFVFELIQNGYDEQPAGSDSGRISLILVQDEGEHGVLYAANTGRGFSTSKVRAIANLGLSDKPVGEGIGNKGVGFKSVLQICEAPEIYSVFPDGSPGFCFRFATAMDIPGLVGGNPTHTKQVLDELSLYSVTVPAESIPERVRQFWAKGYSTVIRLPLHGEAQALVQERLSGLEAPDAPVLLFLRRIQEMTIGIEQDGTVSQTVLTRECRSVAGIIGHFDADIVTLKRGPEYLVLSRSVEQDAVTEAVREAIDNHRLDPRWAESTAPVEVSIAVPYGAKDAGTGRCYTYLPLGAKAPSPFAGHLNAPFFTNLARTDIDASHPLNHLLLTTAAGLSLDAAQAMTSWKDDAAAAAVLDVISWDPTHISLLVDVAQQTDFALPDRPLMPTRTPGRWTSMNDVWKWPAPATELLTPDLAHAACKVEFLPDLERDRALRLEATLCHLELNADPSSDQLADWTEAMLATMLRERRPLSDWNRAYSDVAVLFERCADALRSRHILLTEDWKLQACASGRATDASSDRAATPFFPPVRQRGVEGEDDVDPDAELDLPRSLSRRLYYVNSELTWYENRQRTKARVFLQENLLVRRFDTRSVLEHIRSVMNLSRSQSVASDALRLVFNLTRSGGGSPNVDLRDLGLRVLTAEGTWRPAAECLFSAGWPDTAGDDLTLIAETPEHRSAELSALFGQLLAPPSGLLRKSDDPAAWVSFLRRIGVSEVVQPHSVPVGRLLYGRDLTARHLATVPGIPAPVSGQWTEQLPTRSAAHYPETPYRPSTPVYWLPGQADWLQVTDKVRQALARQLVIGMKRWPDEMFETIWERDRNGDKDPRRVATPFRAFLTTVDWLPVQKPGGAAEQFMAPHSCWTFPLRGDETAPRFAPLVAKTLRDILDDDQQGLRRLRQLGLGIWGKAEDAPRLVRYLGELIADDAVTDVHIPQFRSMYRAAWADCAADAAAEPFPRGARSHLAVEVGGQLQVVPIEDDGSEPSPVDLIVAAADDDRSLRRMLADFHRPILTVGTRAAEVTEILRRRLGSQVTRSVEIAPVVLVDGREIELSANSDTRSLVELLPRLPLLVATLLEHRRGSFVHIGQRAFDDALDALQRVRVLDAGLVEVRVGEETRPLPDRMQGVLPIDDPQHPTLVIQAPDPFLTWEKVEAFAEPLLYILRRPEFATELQLAVTRMRAGNIPVDQFTDADVADACDVAFQDVQTTALRIQAAVAPLLSRLFPVVVYYAGVENAASFEPETSFITAEADALEELVKIAGFLARHTPEYLITLAARASTLDELRLALEIPIVAMNATLLLIGGRHRLIDYGDQHAEDFADYVRQNHARIMDRIRWARWDRFASYDSQSDWRDLRKPASFTPDSTWGTTLDSLSPATMDAWIEAELVRLLGDAPPTDGATLPTIDHVSKSNASLIATSAAKLTAIVRAWQAERGEPIAPLWSAAESASRELGDVLDRAGALDFIELTMDSMLHWIQSLGLWPAEMPRTDDLAALGLTKDKLDEQQSDEARRRAEAVRARRTLEIDGQPFDLDMGLGEFKAAVDASVEATPGFVGTSNRFAQLKEVSGPPKREGVRNGGGGAGGRLVRMSDDQRDAIGFAGEWLAFQWLDRHHSSDFTPACWVSAYRQTVFPGEGDDGLGWDFQVPTRQGELSYEVKTTLGDGGQIELGETQVLAAQEHSRNDRWRLLVVTNALDANRRLRILPNPFGPRARGRYVFVGQGLRLRYAFD